MCHLILALPFFGLALFLFLPFGTALGLYLPLAAGSVFLYFVIVRTMRLPQPTGVESLIGETGEVVGRLDSIGPTRYLVRCRGELWSAVSEEGLKPGEEVRVVAVDGIKLVVTRREDA